MMNTNPPTTATPALQRLREETIVTLCIALRKNIHHADLAMLGKHPHHLTHEEAWQQVEEVSQLLSQTLRTIASSMAAQNATAPKAPPIPAWGASPR